MGHVFKELLARSFSHHNHGMVFAFESSLQAIEQPVGATELKRAFGYQYKVGVRLSYG